MPSPRRFLRLLVACLALSAAPGVGVLQAQAPESETSRPCHCTELFDALATRVETNYPGYFLEVRDTPRAADYARHRSSMRLRAEAAVEVLDCLAILQDYTAWFRDGHLFVGGRPRPADAPARRSTWTEQDVRRYLRERRDALDPIEGLWWDPAGLRIAIVPSDPGIATRRDGGAAGEWIAVVLASEAEGWTPGDVKAELEALPDGSYDVVLYEKPGMATRPRGYSRDHAGGGRLQRDGLLLHMPPTTWGRDEPVRAGLEGRIDPVDPRDPTARLLGSDAVVFHVPSNVPEHAARLRRLVAQYAQALETAETLIIDLRGNEGGSSFVTNVFMPFLVTPEKRPARYLAAGESSVLATPDNIAYFERISWAPAGLVARLRAAEPGTLVPFADPRPAGEADAEEPPRDVATARPKNVAIVTDSMTVSAAEAFVLKAMRNGKVTLFGEATGGSIDYQTVGIVSFGCPEVGLWVGYPRIVGSDRLPEGGVRPTGIVPDVPLDPERPDLFERILDHYD